MLFNCIRLKTLRLNRKTLGFNETKQLVWPRKILICINENAEEWEWTEGLKERFIVIKVSKSGEYNLRIWENNKLVTRTLSEAMNCLGFEIKEVKEMKVEELGTLELDNNKNYLLKN